MKMHETIEECAVRELGEETKYIASDLKQFGVFSKVDRDPRYRVVTVAFYALSEVRPVEGGSDAKEARWFPLGEELDLPFDHNEILKAAKQRLHDDLYLRPVGFDLLPKIFSIPQLQRLYETILDKSFDRRNFQKKMLSTKIVQRVDSTGIVEQKRTTILYSFNKEEYENLKKNGDFRIEF